MIFLQNLLLVLVFVTQNFPGADWSAICCYVFTIVRILRRTRQHVLKAKHYKVHLHDNGKARKDIQLTPEVGQSLRIYFYNYL